MEINNKYNLKDVVYHRMDAEKCSGIITGINVRLGYLSYEVTRGRNECAWHTDAELTTEYLPDYNPHSII